MIIWGITGTRSHESAAEIGRNVDEIDMFVYWCDGSHEKLRIWEQYHQLLTFLKDAGISGKSPYQNYHLENENAHPHWLTTPIRR